MARLNNRNESGSCRPICFLVVFVSTKFNVYYFSLTDKFEAVHEK